MKGSEEAFPLENDPLWYKDAIIYELHVRAFHDSNGDGIGDFRGLVEKLDYLQDLGVTALWLLPFYPVAAARRRLRHRRLHRHQPDLRHAGRLQALPATRPTAAACASSPSWSSTTPPTSTPGSSAPAAPSPAAASATSTSGATRPTSTRKPASSSRTSSRPTGPGTRVANAYYWHRFYTHQPDLNFDNPEVHKAIFEVLDFWLEHGRRRPAPGRRALPLRARGHQLREPAGDARLPQEAAPARRREVPEPHAAGRGQPVARGRRRLLRPAATSATWPSTSRSCRACSWPSAWRTAFRSSTSCSRRRRSPRPCQWALFLRNHDELTLEMVTDEDRDYMYRVYAQDPQARINLGIRRRLAPLLGNHRGQDRADERPALLAAGHAGHLLRRRDRHGRQHLPRRPQRRAHADAVERATATPASRRPTRSGSTCRSSSTRSITTRRSTSRPSRTTRTRCCGG